MADGSLADEARRVLEAHWRPVGFTVPHPGRYPWLWLWDSCFHAVIWAALGDDRAVVELARAVEVQDELGFVPHMVYEGDPRHHADFWGRELSSSITQPPMYGHAVAELTRRGVVVPDALVERAGRGLAFLLRHRRRIEGLVTACHPWETGADDTPRWDDWCPGGFDPARWHQVTGDLVPPIERSAVGSPLGNPAFAVAPAGFNGLVVFNALELAEVTADGDLREAALELAEALHRRWDPELVTWVDAGSSAASSGRVRTLDAFLALLAPGGDEGALAALSALADDRAYGARFGPTGLHRDEPTFDPAVYWRGPAWPQLAYLLWLAAKRRGRHADADRLAATTVAGARASGMAEYWHPDDGTGLGAVPQSWTGLAAVMDGL